MNTYIPTLTEIEAMKYGGHGGGGITYGGGSGISTGAFPTPTTSLMSLLGINNRDKIVRELVDDGYWVKMTGSRVTKDGWTDESDWDYVVYDPDQKLQDVYKQQDGWVLGSDADQGEFASIKKDGLNLILVDKEEIWKKYIIATNLIKTLNSKTKGERIAVFDSVFGKDKNATAVDFGVPF
jgi:predicted nucleotidyltransferase